MSVARTDASLNQQLRQQILRAAGRCFKRYGMSRTSMDDVAAAAGVSRQTVYNYVGNKTTLIAEIIVNEAQRINEQAYRSLDLSLPSAELIAAAELAVVERAERSPYADIFTGATVVKFTADAVAHSEHFAQVQRDYWHAVFAHVRDRGDLRADLDEDEAVNWLNSISFLLATGPTTFEGDRETRRRYLLHYVVPAFLAGGA